VSEGIMATEDLTSILNGTSEPAPEAAAEAPQPEAAPVEASPERPRDEQGRFLPKGDETPPEAAPAAEAAPSATPAPSDDDSSPTVPRKALIDERTKRQTLESQLAEMSQRLAQVQQPAPKLPAPKPDQWDDPEGHERWLIEQAGGIAEQRAVEAFQRQHIMVSAEAAKAKYPDYLEKVDIFERLSAENPALSAQMSRHPNPAEFAYEVAKRHEEVSQYGSIEGLLAAEKAKWEAEALEKLKSSLPSNAPPTLSNERNLGSRSGPAWSGPTSLAALLN
jgi:hypothetical protein